MIENRIYEVLHRLYGFEGEVVLDNNHFTFSTPDNPKPIEVVLTYNGSFISHLYLYDGNTDERRQVRIVEKGFYVYY